MKFCASLMYHDPSPKASNPSTRFVTIEAKSLAEAKRKAKEIVTRADPAEHWRVFDVFPD